MSADERLRRTAEALAYFERDPVPTDPAPSSADPGAGPAPRHGQPRGLGRRRWRRLRRLLLLALVGLFGFELVSYVLFVAQPSSVPFGVRSVEWVRAHVSSSFVNEVERVWYLWNAPDKGGSTLTGLPIVGVRTPLPGGGAHQASSYWPARIAPLIQPALRGEGVWRATGPLVAGAPPVLVTTFRPDPSYPRMVAGVAWIDRARTSLQLYPGRYEPPGSGPRGPMEVPAVRRAALLATFNSGFRLEDGSGGFVANGSVWKALQRGLGTVVGQRDGTADVAAWLGPAAPGPSVAFARQNLPLIVLGGRPNPNLSDGPRWGVTLGNAIRVWRSGLGVDQRGNLIYAAAAQQTAGSLADIFIHAGAVRAMELDINYQWVSFISYGRGGGGEPTKLLFGIDHGGTRYLVPDDRDFFAVYARAPTGTTP